jgi:uncharacterized protein YcfJ
MNFRALRYNVSLVIVLVLLTACATDQQRTRTQGTAAGAVGGAAVGALIGGKGAAGKGALVGAAIGLLAGDAVAKKKAAYAQREALLRGSADRAQQLAQQLRQQNEITTVQIAALGKDIKRLKAQKLSATARKNRAAENQTRLAGLMKGIDDQLVQVKAEITQQQTLLADEQRKAAESHDNTLEPSMQLVSAGVRNLQSSERTLEMAKAQLQLLDPKRKY